MTPRTSSRAINGMHSTERTPKRRCTSGMQRGSVSQSSMATGSLVVTAAIMNGASSLLTLSWMTPGTSGWPYSATQSSPCLRATMALSEPTTPTAWATTRCMISSTLRVEWIRLLISLRAVLKRSRRASSSCSRAFSSATAACAPMSSIRPISRTLNSRRSPGSSVETRPTKRSPT